LGTPIKERTRHDATPRHERKRPFGAHHFQFGPILFSRWPENPPSVVPNGWLRDKKKPFILRQPGLSCSVAIIRIMPSPQAPTPTEPRIIVRGVHLDLTGALKAIAQEKAVRLLRHQEHIIRVRLDLEHDKKRALHQAFVAKGHVEIRGPDLLASVASDDLYKSLDQLIDKLDRMLRKRACAAKTKRHHPHGVEIPAELPKVE
jgi:putative sigma-54 modulation protein